MMAMATPVPAPLHLSTRALRPLLDAATHLGIDVAHHAATVGVDASKLHAPDARLLVDEANALVAGLAAAAGRRSLAAIAAQRVSAGEFGLLDYLAGSGAKLRDAARLTVQFFTLVSDVGRLQLDESGRVARFGFVPVAVCPVVPTLAEFALAVFSSLARAFTGIRIRATEIRFLHGATPWARELQEVFDAPVRYGASCDEIAFPRVYLDLELARADASLHRALVECATALVARLPNVEGFLDRVKRHTVLALREGDVSLDTLARALDMSPRTLQRRLQDSGTSLRDVVADMRRELALEYVASPHLSIAQIALTLGFADPSAFCRAFRRWTGATPRSFRASARARGA